MHGRASTELPDSIGRILRGLFIQVQNADGSPMLGEADGNRLADTAGPACYQSHFIIQTKSAHLVAPFRSS